MRRPPRAAFWIGVSLLVACGSAASQQPDTAQGSGGKAQPDAGVPAPPPEYLTNDPAKGDYKPAPPGSPGPDSVSHDVPGIYDPGGHALDAFHERLASVARGEGKARVMFFGASHVASDLFTGEVRSRLQERFGDGGAGFVLPVLPWRYYRHRGIDIDSNWRRWTAKYLRVAKPEPDYYGLAGMYVTSSHRGDFGALVQDAKAPPRAATYDVLFLAQPNGGDFDVIADGKTVGHIATKAPKARNGSKRFTLTEGVRRFELRMRGNGPVRLFGTIVEGEAPGVVVDTLGINGARATNQLYWDDALFRESLQERDPSLVVLAYGTNEVADDDVPIDAYENDLRKVVARVRETVPDASCLLIGPSDRPIIDRQGNATLRARAEAVIGAQRRVATEAGCGFYDLVAFMGGPMSMMQWTNTDPPLAAPDHVHFTALGYTRLGAALTDALLANFQAAAD